MVEEGESMSNLWSDNDYDKEPKVEIETVLLHGFVYAIGLSLVGLVIYLMLEVEYCLRMGLR